MEHLVLLDASGGESFLIVDRCDSEASIKYGHSRFSSVELMQLLEELDPSDRGIGGTP